MALSDWDKQHLNSGQQRAVLAYTQAWEQANARGDTAAMERAHAGAEAIRRQAGYSGGAQGDYYQPSAGVSGKDWAYRVKEQKLAEEKAAEQAAVKPRQSGYVNPLAPGVLRNGTPSAAGTPQATSAPSAAQTTSSSSGTGSNQSLGVLGGRNPAAVQQREERRAEKLDAYNAARQAYENADRKLAALDPLSVSDEERVRLWTGLSELKQEYEDARKALELSGVNLPGLGERIRRSVLGNAEQWASGFANAAGTAYDLNRSLPTWARVALSGISEGTPIGQLNSIYNALGPLGNALSGAQEQIEYAAADALSGYGSQNIERAKEGASFAGKVALDVIGQGVQMGGDLALATATGGGALVPMAIRSFGSGAQEARQEGADVYRSALYGAANAAVEVITERMFDGLAGIYGAGAADKMVQNVIGRITKNEGARAVLNVLVSAGGEGAEELLSGLVAPALKTIYNGKSLGENYSELEAEEILYDVLIGSLMGMVGGTVDIARDTTVNGGAEAQKNAPEGAGRSATVSNTGNTQAARAAQYREIGVEAQKNASGETNDNLPRRATRTQIKADTEIETENISRGEAAINRLFREAETADNPEELVVEGAMYRSDLGPIDFKWGRPGSGQKFKHGFGLAHLFAKRNAEAGNGRQVANKMAEVIAKATDVDIQQSNGVNSEVYNVRLHYDGYTAVLAKKPVSNHWLLTGWEDNNETAASATGEVHDSSGATAATPTRTRRDGGNATVSYDNIAQAANAVKPSDGPLYIGDDSPAVMEDVARVRGEQANGNYPLQAVPAQGTIGQTNERGGSNDGRQGSQLDQGARGGVSQGEESQSAHRRASESGRGFLQRMDQERRAVREAGGYRYGYRPVPLSEQSANARAITEELAALGVDSIVYDGELQANNGKTTFYADGDAQTLKDGSVAVPNSADGILSAREIAAHETAHSMIDQSIPQALAFKEAVRNNLDLGSDAANDYIETIRQHYFDSSFDISKEADREALLNELCGYISGHLYDGSRDISSMFQDFDAVTSAWQAMINTARRRANAKRYPHLYTAMAQELAEETPQPVLSPQRRARLKAWNEDFPEMRMSEEEFLRR